jgi:organic solute transporter subunit alpha
MMTGDVLVAAINVLGVTLFTVGGASVLLILLLYADTLHHIMKNAPPLVKTHSAFVLSVYPVSYVYHYDYSSKVCFTA